MADEGIDESALPFVAPCRVLRASAPLGWLRLGFADFRRAWPQSLAYGAFMAVTMALVSGLAWRYGSYWFMLAMVGGFVFIAPLTCTGLYVLSAQLDRERRPSLREALPVLGDMLGYLSIGSVVGAVFAALTFAVSAFSLPMIVDRRVDAVTAAVTSINAVLRNKLAMAVWFGLIVVGVVLGFATFFIGLAAVLPVIGHAAWHGYLEAIDASGFPRHESGVTATPEVRT